MSDPHDEGWDAEPDAICPYLPFSDDAIAWELGRSSRQWLEHSGEPA